MIVQLLLDVNLKIVACIMYVYIYPPAWKCTASFYFSDEMKCQMFWVEREIIVIIFTFKL